MAEIFELFQGALDSKAFGLVALLAVYGVIRGWLHLLRIREADRHSEVVNLQEEQAGLEKLRKTGETDA